MGPTILNVCYRRHFHAHARTMHISAAHQPLHSDGWAVQRTAHLLLRAARTRAWTCTGTQHRQKHAQRNSRAARHRPTHFKLNSFHNSWCALIPPSKLTLRADPARNYWEWLQKCASVRHASKPLRPPPCKLLPGSYLAPPLFYSSQAPSPITLPTVPAGPCS